LHHAMNDASTTAAGALADEIEVNPENSGSAGAGEPEEMKAANSWRPKSGRITPKEGRYFRSNFYATLNVPTLIRR
jgi:hypothetical protein